MDDFDIDDIIVDIDMDDAKVNELDNIDDAGFIPSKDRSDDEQASFEYSYDEINIDAEFELIVVDYGLDDIAQNDNNNKTKKEELRSFSKQKQSFIEQAMRSQIKRFDDESMMDALKYAINRVNNEKLNECKNEMIDYFEKNKNKIKKMNRLEFRENISNGMNISILNALYDSIADYAEYDAIKTKLKNNQIDEINDNYKKLKVINRIILSDRIILKLEPKNKENNDDDEMKSELQLSTMPYRSNENEKNIQNNALLETLEISMTDSAIYCNFIKNNRLSGGDKLSQINQYNLKKMHALDAIKWIEYETLPLTLYFEPK